MAMKNFSGTTTSNELASSASWQHVVVKIISKSISTPVEILFEATCMLVNGRT